MWVFRAIGNSRKRVVPDTLMCSLVLSTDAIICGVYSFHSHNSSCFWPTPSFVDLPFDFKLSWSSLPPICCSPCSTGAVKDFAAELDSRQVSKAWFPLTVCPSEEWYINRRCIFVWHLSFSQRVFLSLCPYFWSHSFSNYFITLCTISETQLGLSE